MKLRHILTLNVAIALLFTFPVLAQTATEAGIIELNAQAMSQNLLCDLAGVLSGDLGLILGLCVGFFGFWLLIVNSLSIQGFILILVGVFITAIPNFFITTINAIMSMGSEIFVGTGVALPC